MENKRIPLTESGFIRWIIRNFCELKEHVVAQCKETKNYEKRSDEILMRRDNLERTIINGTEEYNTGTLRSMHRFKHSNCSSRRKDIRGQSPT